MHVTIENKYYVIANVHCRSHLLYKKKIPVCELSGAEVQVC